MASLSQPLLTSMLKDQDDRWALGFEKDGLFSNSSPTQKFTSTGNLTNLAFHQQLWKGHSPKKVKFLF